MQFSKKLFLHIIRLIAFIVIIILLLFSSYISINSPQLLNFNGNLKEPLNLLVLGVDQEYDKESHGYAVKVQNSFLGRTDTIILTRIQPLSQSIKTLHIPRDTRVVFNFSQPAKINSVNTIGGPILTKESLEKVLDVKIDNYISINAKGLEDLIDTAGGITLNVPYRMKYQDKTDGINIDLHPGLQTLSGEQAIGFLRFRKTALGDIGRIQQQQLFIRAAQKKLLQPAFYTRLPSLLSKSFEVVETDLGIFEVIKIVNTLKKIKTNDLSSMTLPGSFSKTQKLVPVAVPIEDANNGHYVSCDGTELPDFMNLPFVDETVEVCVHKRLTSYWLPNRSQIKKLIQEHFQAKLIQTVDKAPHNIQIVLKNSSKYRQPLQTTQKKLRSNGFSSIISTVNHFKTGQHPHSIIYYQKGNKNDAIQIKKKLNLPDSVEIIGSNVDAPQADIVFVIGNDLT